MLQCVAVCCSVLQCVAVCCDVFFRQRDRYIDRQAGAGTNIVTDIVKGVTDSDSDSDSDSD